VQHFTRVVKLYLSYEGGAYDSRLFIRFATRLLPPPKLAASHPPSQVERQRTLFRDEVVLA
jgi:hypothetical protein